MKNLLSCSILLCLLISCSTDSDFNTSELKPIAITKPAGNLHGPENKANPFDFKGKKYYDALGYYWQQNQFPNTIGTLTGQIRFITGQFKNQATTNKTVIPFTDEIVESLMADPDNNMIAIVETSILGDSAKISLINFLQGLMHERQLDFTISYNYIVNYENAIIGNSSWDEDESETILTITSISRYSLYTESERKDRDWDKSTGNKTKEPCFAENEVSIISVIALLDVLY